jgi:hypothetical protein
MSRESTIAKAILATMVLAGVLLAPTAHGAPVRKPVPSVYALVHSRQLWATIDACDPDDQPNTVGVRGSMPGDGLMGDHMYMSFRLQYAVGSNKWVDLVPGARPHFARVGAAASARQGGNSFKLVTASGRPAVTLRGIVTFQWRHGKRVMHTVSRPTSEGHISLAGADPAGTTAATCVIG